MCYPVSQPKQSPFRACVARAYFIAQKSLKHILGKLVETAYKRHKLCNMEMPGLSGR